MQFNMAFTIFKMQFKLHLRLYVYFITVDNKTDFYFI
jgi:hypothetical protein